VGSGFVVWCLGWRLISVAVSFTRAHSAHFIDALIVLGWAAAVLQASSSPSNAGQNKTTRKWRNWRRKEKRKRTSQLIVGVTNCTRRDTGPPTRSLLCHENEKRCWKREFSRKLWRDAHLINQSTKVTNSFVRKQRWPLHKQNVVPL